MAASSERIVEMLGTVNEIQHIDVEFARQAALSLYLSGLTRAELVALAGVLAEGNAYGPDVARRMAGVAS